MPDNNPILSIELSDIFNAYKQLIPYAANREWKVINAITACRTEKLGGDVRRCEHCGHTETHYFSCRDRHCPKCQSLQKEAWILKRNQELLPVPYFHLVFTIPHEFLDLFRLNLKVCYSLLFKAVEKTIKTAAANPDNLGADSVGFFAILHTWDQRLNYHPHVHVVIPGGGLPADKSTWIASAQSFFISNKRLSIIFRAIFCNLLDKQYDKEVLALFLDDTSLTGKQNLKKILKAACRQNWVVYAKPPFNGPYWVVRYLSAYTHKIAISNHRLVSMDNGQVVFNWKDRKDAYKTKQCRLTAQEFMRRFLLHVLPPGFVRIRHYGFMGNVCRKESVSLIRRLLGCTPAPTEPVPTSTRELYILVTGMDPDACRVCGKAPMVDYCSIPPAHLKWAG